MLIVLTTVLSVDEGKTLAQSIIEARLAACVQIFPQMASVYVWEGKVQKESEHLMLIKTLPDRKSTRLNSSHSDLSRMPSSA